MEYKAFKFDLEEVNENEESGVFSGYAAVFGNVDAGGDVIEKGAFTDTLQNDIARIKILTNHDESELPIGKPLEIHEDEKGLYIKAKISDTTKGKDIKTLLKDGVLNELSIGYDVVKYKVDSKGIRHLKKIKLWEVSVVTWAMNDKALIEEVKKRNQEQPLHIKAAKKANISFKIVF